MSSEVYQSYLNSFTNQFYYIDIETDNREDLYNMLCEVSKKMHVPVFAIDNKLNNFDSSQITFFSNEGDFEIISQKYNIEARKYLSFFSGETTIEQKDLTLLVSQPAINRFYFDVTPEEIDPIYYYLTQNLATSYAHKETRTGSEWLIKIIWFVPLLFLLLSTLFSIEFEKKKFFLRVSLGASKIRLIIKNLFVDNLVLCIEFVTLYFVLRSFVYIEYRFGTVLLSFIFFLITNGLLYILGARFKYKEILYSANLNQSLLSNCYLMKSIILIITIASLSVNAFLLFQTLSYFKYYSVIDDCADECFLSITPDYQYFSKYILNSDQMSEYDSIPEELRNTIVNCSIYEERANLLIFDYLYENRIKYVNVELEDDDAHRVLFLNDLSMLLGDKLNIDTTYDFTFLFPESAPQLIYTEEDAINSINHNLGLPEGSYTYIYQTYNCNTEALYLSSEEKNSLTNKGFEIVDNPIMIVCNMDGQRIKAVHKSVNFDYKKISAFSMSNIRFIANIDTIDTLCKKYHYSSCEYVSVPNYYENNEKFFKRIVLLSSVLSVLLIILEFSFILLIIKLEYMINAKILSIKKILGYSILQKNRTIIGLNTFSAIIGTITNLICSCMFNISTWQVIIAVSIGLYAIESIIIVYYITKIEATKVSKILKGGCL